MSGTERHGVAAADQIVQSAHGLVERPSWPSRTFHNMSSVIPKPVSSSIRRQAARMLLAAKTVARVASGYSWSSLSSQASTKHAGIP